MKLNLAVLAYTGFWNCQKCERPSEPIGDPGEPFMRCKYCRRATLVWIPPAEKPESMYATKD